MLGSLGGTQVSFRDKQQQKRGWVIDKPFLFVFGLIGVLTITALFPLAIVPMVSDVPRIVSCGMREIVIIEVERGHKWPAGSISGCRCLLEYQGRIYIDYENRQHTPWCHSED